MKFKRAITNLMIITMLFLLFSFDLGFSVVAASSFITTSGSVIIEAENTSYTVAGITNLYKGYDKGSSNSASGGAYLKPGYRGTSSDVPSGNLMHFTVNADVAGRYTLWVRSKASSDNDASWFDYDNNGYRRKSLGTSGNYDWVKLLSGYYMNSGGSVEFEFYPKDSGHEIDCFIFTKESSYVPSGIVSSLSQIVPVQMPLAYGTPSIIPPVGVHPRLMMRSNDIAAIISNASLTPNKYAKSYFDDLVADYNFSGTLVITPQVNNYNFGILSKIEAHALNYAVFGNSASGNKAKNEILNYLKTVCFNLEQSNITREMGSTIFRAAEVYDWCYNLFTPTQRNELISYCESIAAGMEIRYPVTMLGNISGHGGEFDLFRDLLALGVAVYDERPDIYNHVMGRIEKEMVPARDFYYRSHSGYQGTSYSSFRYHAELYAELIVRKMTGGQKTLFSQDFEEVPYSWIYLHRPDGKLYQIGDDASTEWGAHAYNGYYFWPSFIAGNLFSDRLIKGEFSLGRGSVSKASFSNSNYNNYKSFNSVLWLLINNPSVPFDTSRTEMPESRYFGSPNGMIIANSNKLSYAAAYPSTSTTASALMKIGEVYGGNHDHLDAGSFQLYYKGILASASGVYDSYGNSHDINYYKRTISSNTLTVFKSSESFGGLNPASNDGGQKWNISEAKNFSQWRSGDFDRAQILDHKIDDNNSFSYIRGDLTDAYSSKVSNVQRAMAFIPTDNADFPAFMAVYDKITSTNTGYTKKFILHTQTEPSISANTATVTNTGSGSGDTYNGKMNVTSLLPQSVTINKVGGNNAFSVNGTNYAPNSIPANAEEGWGRLEISPKNANLSDDFLTILTVSDATNSATVTPELILGTNLKGAKVLDKVVMFSSMSGTAKNRVTSSASFSVDGGEQLDFMIFGLKAGLWNIMCGSQTVGSFYTDDNAASVDFSGMGGTYSLSYAADQSAGTMLSSLKYKIGENIFDIENFSVSVFDYTVTIPANTTQINIIPTTLDSSSTVQTTLSETHSGKLATVTVSDGTNTSDYYITFVYADSHILSLNAARNNGNDYSSDTAVWKDLSGAENDVNLLPSVISGWTKQGMHLSAPLSICDEENTISGLGGVVKKGSSIINSWLNNGSTAPSRAEADYLEIISPTSSTVTGIAKLSPENQPFASGSSLTEDRFAKISFDYKNGKKDGSSNTGNIQFRMEWASGNDQWIYCRPNDIYSNKNSKVIGNYNASGYTHFDLVFNLKTGICYAFIDGSAEPVDTYTVASSYLNSIGLNSVYFYGASQNGFLLKNPEKVMYSAGTTLNMIKDEISGKGIMLPQVVSDAVALKNYTFSFVTPQLTSNGGKNMPIITSSDGNIECYLSGANNKVVLSCPGISQMLELDEEVVTDGYNIVVVNNDINVVKWYVNGVLIAQSSFSGEQLPCSGVMLSSSKGEYGGSAVMSRLDWYNVALDEGGIQSKYNEYYEEGMESAKLLALGYIVHGNTFNIENFNSNVYEYSVTIPASTTQLETVPTLVVDTSNVQTMWSDISGGRRATVIVSNEQFTQTYYINFMYANPYILGLDVLRNNGSGYNASATVWRNLNGSGNDVNIPSGVISGWTEQGLVLNAPLSYVSKETVISGNGEIVKKGSTIVNAWMNDGTMASSRASSDYVEVISATTSMGGMILSSNDGAAFEAGSQLTEDRYAKISFDYKNGNKDGTKNTGNIQLRVRWGTGTGGSNDQWIYCRPDDIYSNKNGKIIGSYNESGYTHFDLVFNLSTGTSYAFIDGNKEPVDTYTISPTYYTQGGLQNVYFYGMLPDAFLLKNSEKVLYSTGATLDTIIDEICGNGVMLPEEVSSAVEVGNYSFSFVATQMTSTGGKNTPIITSSDGNIECYLNSASNKVVLSCTGIAQTLELDKDIVTSGYNTVVVDSTTNTISWYIDGELKTQSSLSGGTEACSGVMLSSAKSENGGSVVISRLNWYGIALSLEDISAQYTDYLNESFTGVSIKESSLSDGELTASIYANGDFDGSSVIVAAYDDGLVSLDILDYAGSGNYNIKLSIPSGFDGYLKAYVWDFETLTPLTPFAMWENTVE